MSDDPDVGMSVSPSSACRRLRHPIVWLEVATGTGDRVEICVICSMGWARARAEFGEAAADDFVKALRNETQPWNEDEPPPAA
jgi:hypothetical protein